MAALPGFNEPDGAVGDIYNGYEIVEVFNAGAGRYGWEPVSKFESVVSSELFGVKGDGADCTTALQAAVDACKATDDAGSLTPTKTLVLPEGTFTINSPIVVRSGVRIVGAGVGTKITKGGSFSGDSLISLQGGNQGYCIEVVLDSLAFVGTGSTPAIAVGTSLNAATAIVASSRFCNLWFDIPNCIVMTYYLQSCSFENLFSYGYCERFIDVAGNFLYFNRITKEGNSGTSTDPYFRISRWTAGAGDDSTGLSINNILLEGGGSVNKTPFVLDGVDHCAINSVWLETNATNGYALKILNSGVVRIAPQLYFAASSTRKFLVEDTKDLDIEMLDIDGSASKLTDVLEVTHSNVRISTLFTRANEDLYRVTNNAIKIERAVNRSMFTAEPTGESWASQLHYSGGNLLSNPSFEAGQYGWTYNSSGTATYTHITSTATTGLMLNVSITATALTYVTQDVTVRAGIPHTFTALVKVTGSGYIASYVSGSGVSDDSGAYNRVNSGSGWAVITQTFTPTSTGTVTVGLVASGSSAFTVDSCSLTVGDVAIPDCTSLREIQLNGRTIANGSTTPSTGTWKVGDCVLNSEPSSGESPGWMCVTAGSPGTWLPLPVLGPVGQWATGSSQISINAASSTPYTEIVDGTGTYKLYMTGGLLYNDTNRVVHRNVANNDIWNDFDPSGDGYYIAKGATRKLGFWGASPVVQPTSVADATNGTDVITQLNSLLAKLRTIGIIAT